MSERQKGVRAVLDELLNPIRRNDLKKRRERLKLSQAALARILDIDPSTVYRMEHGKMSALWDYALRGIEAEAKTAAPVLRSHQETVDRRDFIPEQMIESGHRFTGERMKKMEPRPPRPPRHKSTPEPIRTASPRMPQPLSREAIKAMADRAEARSKAAK